MNQAVYTYTLLIGVVIALLAMLTGARSYHLPDNQQDYQPKQPIAFSHHLHAGQLSIDCQYCHTAAETSRHAGIPSADICMNCHSFVTSSWGAVLAEDELAKEEERKPNLVISDELKILYEALALSTDGTLTLAANVSNADTITIADKVYTFETELTDVDGHVLIGGSASASIDNLIAAINLAAGAGATYAASTTANVVMLSAVAGDGDTMTLRVPTAGAITTTETSADASWGAATSVHKSPKPIQWVKVHNLPDYVHFDHRAHVHAGVDCQTCHGNVESMERVRQVQWLSMGWCVNCHRESNRIGVKGKPVNASQDCTTCHY